MKTYRINCQTCGMATVKYLKKNETVYICAMCGKRIPIKHYQNTSPWKGDINSDPISFKMNVESYINSGFAYQAHEIASKLFEQTRDDNDRTLALECGYADAISRSAVHPAYLTLNLIVKSSSCLRLHESSYYQKELDKFKTIVGAKRFSNAIFKDFIHKYKPDDITYEEYAARFCVSAIATCRYGCSSFPTGEQAIPFIEAYAQKNKLDLSAVLNEDSEDIIMKKTSCFTREDAMNLVEEMHKNGSSSITIPENFSTIEGNVSFDSIEYFDECKTVVLSANIKNVPEYCFAGTGIRNITMIGAEYIGISAFEGCSELASICAPNIKSIKESGFADCTSLKEIHLPNLISVSYLAFDNSGIENFDAPDSLVYIGAGAFDNDKKTITLNLGKSKPYIEGIIPTIFYTTDNGNPYYTSINGSLFSKDLTVLYSFYNGNAPEVEIPESTTIIGRYAFGGINVEKLVIPESVIFIKDNAFVDAKIGTLEIKSKNVSFENGAGLSEADIAKLECPNDHRCLKCGSNYIIEDDTLLYLSIRKSDCNNDKYSLDGFPLLRYIKKGAIHYCGKLPLTIEFHDGLVRLDGNPFSKHSNIKKIILPSTISDISEETFEIFVGDIDIAGTENINFYSEKGLLYKTDDPVLPFNMAKHRNNKPIMFKYDDIF